MFMFDYSLSAIESRSELGPIVLSFRVDFMTEPAITIRMHWNKSRPRIAKKWNEKMILSQLIAYSLVKASPRTATCTTTITVQ